MHNLFKSNKGVSVVLFVFGLGIIVATASLSIDIGLLALEKARLSSTIDAATLAGAQELVSSSGNTTSIVQSYVQKNSDPLKSLDVNIDAASRTLEVKGVKTVEAYFARVFGNAQKDISASAKARIENISAINGARPLAVVQQTFIYGNRYTLKEGGGDGTSGNYAAIALGGTGGSRYRDNLLYGYNDTITVGDLIQTETGNIAGTTHTCISQLIQGCNHTPLCNYQYYNKSCSRIIFIPIVDTLEVNGRKYIKVLGFGTFFLEGVTSQGGQADVIGRFITYNLNGQTSSTANDYGTYNIRLIQ